MRVVINAQLIGDGQQQRVGLRDRFIGTAGRKPAGPRDWCPPADKIADTDDRSLLLHVSEWVGWQLSIGLKESRIFVFDRSARGGNVPAGSLRVGVMPSTLLDVCYMQIATALAEREPVGLLLVRYLNRLSDLLFVMARVVNRRADVAEPQWIGRER